MSLVRKKIVLINHRINENLIYHASKPPHKIVHSLLGVE